MCVEKLIEFVPVVHFTEARVVILTDGDFCHQEGRDKEVAQKI
jgi:hypothetical protein